MNFLPGDFVKFLDETGDGIITKLISKKMAMIDIGGGLEIQAETGELILIYRHEQVTEKSTETETAVAPIQIQDPTPKTNPKPILKVKHKPTPKKTDTRYQASGIDVRAFAESLSTKVFDLHIEKLTNKFSHLSNGEIMQIQLQKFDQIINEALQGRYRRVVIIHGIGEGTLRKEMHARLKEYESITYFDADERKFGYGATEVVLK